MEHLNDWNEEVEKLFGAVKKTKSNGIYRKRANFCGHNVLFFAGKSSLP